MLSSAPVTFSLVPASDAGGYGFTMQIPWCDIPELLNIVLAAPCLARIDLELDLVKGLSVMSGVWST